MGKKKFKDEIKDLREIKGDLISIKEAIADGVTVEEISILVEAFKEAKKAVRKLIRSLRDKPGYEGELEEEIGDLLDIKANLIVLKNDVADGVDVSEVEEFVADVIDVIKEVKGVIQDLRAKGDVVPPEDEDDGGNGNGEDDGGDGGEDDGVNPFGTPIGTFAELVVKNLPAVEAQSCAAVQTDTFVRANGEEVLGTELAIGDDIVIKDGYRYRVVEIIAGENTTVVYPVNTTYTFPSVNPFEI